MRKWFRAVLIIAAACCLALPVRGKTLGSIQVKTQGGAVALYRVGGINGQGFLLEECYGGEALSLDQILSDELAKDLDEMAKTGIIKAPDLYGKVMFTDLEEGLYLLAQRSYPSGGSPFAPTLVAIPWDGMIWDVIIDPYPMGTTPVTEDESTGREWMPIMVVSGICLAVCVAMEKGRAVKRRT